MSINNPKTGTKLYSSFLLLTAILLVCSAVTTYASDEEVPLPLFDELLMGSPEGVIGGGTRVLPSATDEADEADEKDEQDKDEDKTDEKDEQDKDEDKTDKTNELNDEMFIGSPEGVIGGGTRILPPETDEADKKDEQDQDEDKTDENSTKNKK